jgi:hypothetical protein
VQFPNQVRSDTLILDRMESVIELTLYGRIFNFSSLPTVFILRQKFGFPLPLSPDYAVSDSDLGGFDSN